MDLYMPGMDGDEACKTIKSDFRMKSTPIVMVTSSNRPGDIDRCRKAGCDDVIHKPLTREDFLNASRKFITFPAWSGRRVKIHAPVKFGNDAGMSNMGSLFDISVGGVFVETEEQLPIDTVLDLEFRLNPKSALIQCKGRVAWLNRKHSLRKDYASAGMGLEFIEIKKMDLLNIQSYVKETS
jgi:CheY-like chemotaxis protein